MSKDSNPCFDLECLSLLLAIRHEVIPACQLDTMEAGRPSGFVIWWLRFVAILRFGTSSGGNYEQLTSPDIERNSSLD